MVLCCQLFGVRVSVTFHLMCVHIICSSVWVAEWPAFGERAAHSVDHLFSTDFDYLLFKLYPVLVLRAGFGF